MTAQPQRPVTPDDGRIGGLKEVTHVIAVSSCKGGAQLAVTSQLINFCRPLKKTPIKSNEWGYNRL